MSNSSSSQNKMRFKLNSSYDMTQINCIELTFENYLHLWLIQLNCPCLLFKYPTTHAYGVEKIVLAHSIGSHTIIIIGKK